MNILELQNLQVSIGNKNVCQKLDLELQRGQCWGILGGNGVGKTTLLHTMAGLRRPDDGRIILNGTPLTQLPRRAVACLAGVLFQETPDPFVATVFETALLGRHPHLSPWQWEDENDYSRARQALESVDLSGMEQRASNTLSGGERQRLAIATLLTQSPELFLLDEPTNHLDLHHQVTLVNLLVNRSRDQYGALIMTLHDVNLAARFCDHLLLLFGAGATLQGRTRDILNSDNLKRLYGHPIVEVQSAFGTAYLPG